VALLFREVNNVMWWDPFRSPSEAWLGKDELRGDALKSLGSRDNTLSVYILDEDTDSLERVIAAFASQRERLSNLDFALVDSAPLELRGFLLETLDGRTPDSVVNTWHRDLVHLTGARILELAEHMQIHAAFCRRRKAELKRIISKGIGDGWLDTTKMRKELLDDVTPR
jgi:hypothetical protein